MKNIVVNQDEMEKIVRETVAKAVSFIGLAPAKQEIEINPSVELKEEDKIELVFSETARKKMYYLIQECEKEIAWHGLVERTDNGFYVEDIIMFPQNVTGATVTTDDDKYPTWMNTQPNEIFEKIRFHGHSHVNMGVTPSGVDETYQENILRQRMTGFAEEKGFYIFGIFNKEGDYWLNIYDIDNNKLYETDDIKYMVYEPHEQDWAKEQIKEYVTIQTFTPAYRRYGGTGYYGSHYGSGKIFGKTAPTEEKTNYDADTLYDTWRKNHEEDKKDEEDTLLGQIIADIAPPAVGERWSNYLQRAIRWDENLDDLIEEYTITYPSYEPQEKKEEEK